MNPGDLLSRLLFKQIEGRGVFYPYGSSGPGYLVSESWQQRIRRFITRWAAGLLVVVALHVALHIPFGASDSLAVVSGLYMTLLLVYVLRVAAFVKRLKITPKQLGVEGVA